MTFRMILLTSCVVFAAQASAGPPIDFDTQVIPVLTKAGCNSGACHGAAAGRGGFRLSLYGSRPDSDYAEIAYALHGRRIDSVHPELSLLLQKPAEMMEHGGGQRLTPDGDGYEVLLQWIRQGADRRRLRSLDTLTLNVRRLSSVEGSDTGLNVPFCVSAIARFDDGAEKDVTRWTIFVPADPDAIRLKESGQLIATRPGRHVLTARFLDRVQSLEIIVPFSPAPSEHSAGSAGPSTVDDFIDRRLAQLGIEPAGQASDEVLIRRLTLDLTGRLPDPRAVTEFCHSQRADKLRTAVNRLIDSEDFCRYWTFRLARMLELQRLGSHPERCRRLYDRLQQYVKDDMSLLDMCVRMVTAVGDTTLVPEAEFHNLEPDPRRQAELFARAFLGIRLQCANCHDHPLDVWTQDDYHGLAAVFATVSKGPQISVNPTGHVIHPATGTAARLRLPGDRFLPDGTTDALQSLGQWLADSDNRLFATAFVNRIWADLMGRGLVHPTDDHRATNPATHPELLQFLAEQFVREGCRLKPLIRNLCTSRVYARRSDISLDVNSHLEGFYVTAEQKLMRPEVFLDAVDTVLTRGGSDRGGYVSADGITGMSQQQALLGECEADASCSESGSNFSSTTLQLHLLNGELLNGPLQLRKISDEEISDANIAKYVKRQYLLTLSRKPTANETRFWISAFEKAADTPQKRAVARDFVWALLTSKEFCTIR